ncbi:TetR/AcrR family transcriptional regulator [Brachybacterium hainanense]|uniref:TetR/AcrR family transcriptional regulator n=1 Tax=Brachybacterium hainanense TaxID=1541174 RepID=A0ABV6R9E5_9MICO
MSARDALLDAYEAILLDDGVRAATLEAVAARAGVSKGGLLYHFPSKDALVAGLVARLEALAAEDRDRMRQAPEGAVRYYIRTSNWSGSSLDRALVATSQLAQESDVAARDVVARIGQEWLELIVEQIGDRAISRAILLIGDGLYYNAALTGGTYNTLTGEQSLEELLEVVDHLVELAGARRAS